MFIIKKNYIEQWLAPNKWNKESLQPKQAKRSNQICRKGKMKIMKFFNCEYEETWNLCITYIVPKIYKRLKFELASYLTFGDPYQKVPEFSWLPSQTSSAKWFVLYIRFRSISWRNRRSWGNFENAVLVTVNVVGLHPSNQGRF